MNLIAPSRFAPFLETNRASPSPAGGDARAVNGREREKVDFEVLDRLGYRRHEPRTGGVHCRLAGIEERVGVVVGDGVHPFGVVATLDEVPEKEIDDLHHLGVSHRPSP
jgi:hypothetical protein